ncbi:basic-leucine zipper transcription factor [Mucor lusitanicus CBS 277.49]|uniref:Basic-leucine zipper transcription factor n=2 Tax=Mucor circinelloides f. lusitanicus TaxID=29924 RepID=A0A162QJN8_MUCCL|nr:basic-leucine zipper transcription factor [Mucor lusitanicus CBS 277.49]
MNFHPQWQQQQQQQPHQSQPQPPPPPPLANHYHHHLGQSNKSLLFNHQSLEMASNSTSDQSSTEDISSKRKQSLERNRLAAYRCRERKKHEQQQMIEQADFLSVQNESLNMMVGDLRNEVIALRELLLAHDSCHCEGVQAFIRRTSSTL